MSKPLIYSCVIAFAFFTLFGVFSGGLQFSDSKPNEQTLTIGLQSGYPPFDFLDAEGHFVGYDVDVARSLAAKLGKQLVIKDMDFEGIILSLKQGKIDLIISGMNITPSRLKEIAMVPYHGDGATHLSLLFWKKIPEGVHSLEDLTKHPNATVSVEAGAIPEMYIEHYPQLPAKSFQGALNALMDVKFGKSTANLVEPDVAQYLKNKHPEIQILNVPLPPEEKIMGFGIGIKKDNKQLVQQVSEMIENMKASGELKQLQNKWFKGA